MLTQQSRQRRRPALAISFAERPVLLKKGLPTSYRRLTARKQVRTPSLLRLPSPFLQTRTL